MSKLFKTLDEQLDLLRNRGLKIENEQVAKDFLLHHNYYRISGYSLTLRNHDVFYPTTSFNNIIEIYNFDEGFRALLFSYIEQLEVSIKSIYAYFFVQRYGPLGYLTSNNFIDPTRYNDVFKKVEDQKNKRLSHEAFIRHFVNDLKEDLPFWAYIDLFTISDLSKLFHISQKCLKSAVANELGLTFSSGADTLGKYLYCLTILRNLCAHGSRLFNRLFITKPTLSTQELALLRKDAKGHPDNSKLFGYLINMKRLLSKDSFNNLITSIITLNKQYPFVCMRYYGFCDNWENLI